jgi:hypothetical protein
MTSSAPALLVLMFSFFDEVNFPSAEQKVLERHLSIRPANESSDDIMRTSLSFPSWGG